MDGTDVLAVYEAMEQAVVRARAGDGPSLIECKTYRLRAHTERLGQLDRRSQEEIETWEPKEPIKRLATDLMAQGILNEEAWQKMDGDILAEIEAAVRFAEDSPFPDPETAVEDVFVDG